MKLQRLMKNALLILTVMTAVPVLTSCGQNTFGGQAPVLYASVVAQVDSARVTRGDVQSFEILSGLTRAQSEAVRLESGGGRLERLYAWPGDSVVEGQVLARLEASQLEEQISNVEESIQQSLTLHRIQLEEMNLRLQLLRISGNGNPASTEMIEWLNLDISHLTRRHNLNMEDAQATLSYLEENLSNKEIRAPFDGDIIHVMELGQVVNVNDPVLYIARPREIFVEYVGMAMNLPWLRDAVRLYGIIDGAYIYELELLPTTVEQQIYYSRRGLSVPKRFEILPGIEAMPLAGELIFIHLYTVWVEDVLRIPSNALFHDAAGYNAYVYRIEAGNQVRVYVTIGTETVTYTEVTEGLSEGDEIFVRP